MRIENEYCQVELVLDDPERTYRDVDVVSGTVRFEAGDQQLLVYCQPKIGFGVELYGADNARRVAEHGDDIEIKLQPVPSEAGADDVAGLGSVNSVGAVMRVEHDDPDEEEPEPLAVEAGETGEIRFSQRVGDDVPSFRGEILGCRPAMVASFWINVGADEAGNPVDSTEGTCWAPIRLEVVSSGDSEEQMGERAAELQEQLQGHIKATQEWPLGRLLKWACILLSPMLAVIPLMDHDPNPGKNAIDMASVLVLVLGMVCPSWIGAGMLLLLVRRWFRNMKSDQGRSLDPAEGYHVVYLLDGRDRLLYFVYWDSRRTKAEPRLKLRLEFRESCLMDYDSGEPEIVHSHPVTELQLSLADAASIGGGLLMTGTVSFSDDLPAGLLPFERSGWQGDEQIEYHLDLFVGVHARLEADDGQSLEITEEVFSSTRDRESIYE